MDAAIPVLEAVYSYLKQHPEELVHVAKADHVDTLGHYYDPDVDPPHFDWFHSGASFRRDAFDLLWNDVYAFLTRGATAMAVSAPPHR